MSTALTLEFSGGSEFLVGNEKMHKVDVPGADITVKHLIDWVRNEMLKDCDRPELLIEKGTVRPGVLVLINECDWELHDQIDTALKNGDTVTFISTLHGMEHEKLVPFKKLDDDYYVGEADRPGALESEDEMSSDDELQAALKEIAGIPTCAQKRKLQERSEFEDDMENELDVSITAYAGEHMGGSQPDLTKMDVDDGPPPLESDSDDDEPGTSPVKKMKELLPAPAKSALKKPKVEEILEDQAGSSLSTTEQEKHVTIKEEHSGGASSSVKEKEEEREEETMETEENPIKNRAKKMEQQNEELPEFYDADEDDENERWMAAQRLLRKGRTEGDDTDPLEGLDEKQRRSKIDDGSDAVLSCPGCMSLLTRDCQRHEVYHDQYRAMFVENVTVEDELLTVQKTGKEKRKQKQKLKKDRKEPTSSTDDIFYPVKCAVCSTSVAVVDLEDVYHFFNVLAGYA